MTLSNVQLQKYHVLLLFRWVQIEATGVDVRNMAHQLTVLLFVFLMQTYFLTEFSQRHFCRAISDAGTPGMAYVFGRW